ncbi:MAG: hypothetical protein HQ518_14110 [Rhodopirellula sp.]|nr:hypothetical protein [Rhodopirellula sp.]
MDTDPEDDITLEVLGLPSFASFMDHGDGTGLISVNPSTSDEGEFPISVQAISGDQDLTDFELALSQLIGSGS